MSATLIGLVGLWGIASDETGMIVESIEDTSKKQSNFLRNKVGHRVGRADYDESVAISIKGKVTATSGWSQKVSSELVMANTITGTHLQSAGAGETYIDEVQRTRSNEDWQGIAVEAEMLPYFASA